MGEDSKLVELRRYTQSEGLRLFYLLKRGYTDAEIASELSPGSADGVVSASLVAHWVESCRLAQFREKRTPEQEQSIAAHRAEQRKDWVEHVAVESAALSTDGFAVVREKIAQGDARGMNDAARAVNTLVQMARQADGMDSDAKASKGDTFNLYIARIGEAGIEEAKPIDIVATPTREPIELL
jgi:hypothetical protein